MATSNVIFGMVWSVIQCWTMRCLGEHWGNCRSAKVDKCP